MTRRWLWMVACLLGLVPSMADAAIAQVQHRLVSQGGGSAEISLTYNSNVTSNHLLVAYCSAFQASFDTGAPTFSDTQGNTWSAPINQGSDDAGSTRARLYGAYAVSGSSSVNTVTCTGPQDGFLSMVIIEYSGIATSTPLDRSTSNSGLGGTTVSTGTTAATTQADEVLVAGMTYDSNVHPGAITEQGSCVLVDEQEDWDNYQPIAVCDHVVSSTGTFSESWTIASDIDSYAAGIMTFKAAAASRRRSVYVGP